MHFYIKLKLDLSTHTYILYIFLSHPRHLSQRQNKRKDRDIVSLRRTRKEVPLEGIQIPGSEPLVCKRYSRLEPKLQLPEKYRNTKANCQCLESSTIFPQSACKICLPGLGDCCFLSEFAWSDKSSQSGTSRDIVSPINCFTKSLLLPLMQLNY